MKRQSCRKEHKNPLWQKLIKGILNLDYCIILQLLHKPFLYSFARLTISTVTTTINTIKCLHKSRGNNHILRFVHLFIRSASSKYRILSSLLYNRIRTSTFSYSYHIHPLPNYNNFVLTDLFKA